jgi:hypothetical protein
VELVQEVLRPLDGPGHELRVEHHEQRIDPEVPLRRLLPSIDLDGVAHRLERVERQPDGQHDAQERQRGVAAGDGDQRVQVLDGEVVVLEEREHADVGDEAHDQEHPPASALRGMDRQPGEVVDDDGEEEDEDVDGDERHVEHGAGTQQHRPPEPVGQDEVEKGDDRIEDQEFDRAEEHDSGALPSRSFSLPGASRWPRTSHRRSGSR